MDLNNMEMKDKLKVFITIDTEVWEFYENINDNINSGLWGITNTGEYGLKFQLEKFREYNLKATFFLEPFFSYHSGTEPLLEAITQIRSFNQELGLHVHTEWLQGINELDFKVNEIYNNIGEFELKEQEAILKDGLKLLQMCGGGEIDCFRAGNYGADNNTLKALHNIGIRYDTSYNHSYLGSPCNIEKSTKTSPYTAEKTTEYPITQFFDYPNHYRHLQLSACSFSEIKDVLLSNWANEQYCCVLVMHSFEWIKRVKDKNIHVLDPICLKRFEDVCQFLAENTDKFKTSSYAEEKHIDLSKHNKPFTAKAKYLSTLKRLYEQLKRRNIRSEIK